MDASSQKPHSNFVIGAFFVFACVIVGCIIYYITKDNTKTENFLQAYVPTITEKIPTTGVRIPLTRDSCKKMINDLTDQYKIIMGKPVVVDFQCTEAEGPVSFFETLYSILQVPTLKILTVATSVDNIDNIAFINLWLIVMNGINNGSVQITLVGNSPSSGIKILRNIQNENVFISASEIANHHLDIFPITKPYPEVPSFYSEFPNFSQSLTDISKQAMKFITPQDVEELKVDTSSIIMPDKMTKLLLLMLVVKGTLFSK